MSDHVTVCEECRKTVKVVIPKEHGIICATHLYYECTRCGIVENVTSIEENQAVTYEL